MNECLVITHTHESLQLKCAMAKNAANFFALTSSKATNLTSYGQPYVDQTRMKIFLKFLCLYLFHVPNLSLVIIFMFLFLKKRKKYPNVRLFENKYRGCL